MKYRDYYEILSVPRTASQAEIRKAFRKKARIYHPDVAKDKATAEDKFKEINEAYEVLGDPEKRKKYDTLGLDWESQAQGPGHAKGSGANRYEHQFSGTGFSDFFEQMFGSSGHAQAGGYHEYQGGPAAQGSPVPRPRQDIYADILVSLDEVVNGTERTLSLRQINRSTGASELKTSRIRIPSGIRQGQMIRCAGLGNPGSNGAPSGDLFLRTRLEKHPVFRVVESDLYTDLLLAPWEAILGAEIPVPTLGGDVKIKIPPFTSNATEFRIKGKGLPHGGAPPDSDLYAVVQITNPPTASEKETKLWKELAKVSSFSPRQI